MKNLRLKSARAAKDMSQEDLAKACNVTRQTINAIEKETTIPPLTSVSPSAEPWTRLLTNYFGKNKKLLTNICHACAIMLFVA